MNKKIVFSAIGVSSLLMAGSVYATSTASSTTYDTLKTALKQVHTANSLTAEANIAVTDNGKTLFTVQTVTKSDQKNHDKQTKVAINDTKQTKTIETYQQDGQTIVKPDGDTYYKQTKELRKEENMEKKNEVEGHQLPVGVEKLIDALTLKWQDRLSETKAADGTKEIDFTLSESDVPAALNAIATFMANHAGQMNHDQKASKVQMPHPQLPEFAGDVKIKSVQFETKLGTDNNIQAEHAVIVVSGMGVDGQTHEVKVEVQAQITNVNKTTVQPLDLTGKKVEELKVKFGPHERMKSGH